MKRRLGTNETKLLEKHGEKKLRAALYHKPLTDRESKCLELRYGFDCTPLRFRELAALFQVSRARIQQVTYTALHKLEGTLAHKGKGYNSV